jgi:uncharacterized repeat protein (TIGR03803 family)
MRPSSAADVVCRIFLTFLLASAILPTPAHAQAFTVLHIFKGAPNDGEAPYGPLSRDSAGNLYGVTVEGGRGECSQSGCGMAFALNRAGRALGSFSFDGENGQYPSGGLLRDSAGNFYGTTEQGGDATDACGGAQGGGCGVAYRLTKAGKEELYRFQGTPDGYEPGALLTEDAAGNFYGTTGLGGEDGSGTVFKIDRAGKETVLYSFTGGLDGCNPDQGVILDALGNLYGTTSGGGAGFCNSGFGTVYELDTAGKLTVLHTFEGEDGANPDSGLIFDPQGNLYGTTQNGGASEGCGGCGTVFELTPQQGGNWSEGVLYSFCSLPECADGERPRVGPLVRDRAGNLYGTTYFGGAYRNCNGDACGVVFEIDAAGHEQVLHSFTGGVDGALPTAGLIIDASGNLYGTTEEGGDTSCYPPYGCGVAFEITP